VPFTSSTSVAQQMLVGPIEPEALFAVLTDADLTPFFFNRCSFQSDFQPGGAYTLRAGDAVLADGTILEYDPPENLLMTFRQRWDPENTDPPSRVRFVVQARPPLCEFTVVHDELVEGSPLNAGLADSWLMIASALKTLVEAGRVMPLQPDEGT
jgi:uncharacterized protein YndB with AHSA1/START domain